MKYPFVYFNMLSADRAGYKLFFLRLVCVLIDQKKLKSEHDMVMRECNI